MAMNKNELRKTLADCGRLPAWVWPGGYPIVYALEDGGHLCPQCANGVNDSDASLDNDDPQWNIIGAYIHWEGKPMRCDHCNAEIESAYGGDGEE